VDIDEAWFTASMTEPGRASVVRREAITWLRIVGYFVVFFAALTLGGILFTAGGVGLILLPGPLPFWLGVAYVGVGIVGSVLIAVLVANRVFRTVRAGEAGTARRSDVPSLLGWVAGVIGTIVAGALSAVFGALILRLIER
jgi:hypothetical protein